MLLAPILPVTQRTIRILPKPRPSSATRLSERHWSVRSASEASGISKSTIGPYFALFGLQAHRAKRASRFPPIPSLSRSCATWWACNLNPPDKALLLCADEKSEVQRWSAPSRCCRWGLVTSKA
jgi:hypothetical protein